MYEYGLLKLSTSKEVERQNDYWLGPDTLGIEVTSPILALRCGLGNIDPQHKIGGDSSAIEVAFSHKCMPPKEGSKLVTIRPDKDSIGAMAVLTLKAQGRRGSINELLVSWIGAMDRHGYKAAAELYPELRRYFHTDLEAVALNRICRTSEPWPLLEDKVFQVGRILCGEMPLEELKGLYSMRQRQTHRFSAKMVGDIALVLTKSNAEQARDWANGHFRVAVILDSYHGPTGDRRFSIIRRPGNLDRWGCEESLNKAEAGARRLSLAELREKDLCWGGNVNILSSPAGTGRATKLSKRTVLSIVRRHLESGIVT